MDLGEVQDEIWAARTSERERFAYICEKLSSYYAERIKLIQQEKDPQIAPGNVQSATQKLIICTAAMCALSDLSKAILEFHHDIPGG